MYKTELMLYANYFILGNVLVLSCSKFSNIKFEFQIGKVLMSVCYNGKVFPKCSRHFRKCVA